MGHCGPRQVPQHGGTAGLVQYKLNRALSGGADLRPGEPGPDAAGRWTADVPGAARIRVPAGHCDDVPVHLFGAYGLHFLSSFGQLGPGG